jgi:precorrin-6B methylase 1
VSHSGKIDIIALGLGPDGLGKAAKQALAGAELLAGGQRLLDMFPEHPARRLSYESPPIGLA